MSILSSCVCPGPTEVRKESDTPELELEMVVDQHLGARNQTWNHLQEQVLLTVEQCLQPQKLHYCIALRKKIPTIKIKHIFILIIKHILASLGSGDAHL